MAIVGNLGTMNLAEVANYLDSIPEPARGVSRKTGISRGAAYIKFSKLAAPTVYAVVSTPGDRWFSLDTYGGFAYDYFEEGIPDTEAIQLLEKLVQAARARVEGVGMMRASRYLGVPVLEIETDQGPVALHLPLLAAIKQLLRSAFLPSAR